MKRAGERRSTGAGSPAPVDKRAAVVALADQGIEDLAAALAAGQSADLERYLAVMGRFHRYSFHNCLLIAMQRPAATLVAGYGRWQDLGRQVRKGERGIMILAPCLRRVEEAEGEEQPAGRRVTGFRVAYVFDVDQTDGETLPGIGQVDGDPARAGAAVDQLLDHAAGLGIAVTFGPVPGRPAARGGSAGGRVWVTTDLTSAETLRVLAHELAHEALHHDGETRPARVRETEADAVAHVVCAAVGLEVGAACSDYIQMWQGDVATLAASLERVRRVSRALIEVALGEGREALARAA